MATTASTTTRKRAAAKPTAAKTKAAAKPAATTRARAAKPAKPKVVASPGTAPVTVEALLDMSQHELDNLFKHSPEGKIPSGEGEGTVIVATGTPLTGLLAPLLRLGWQGKVVDGKTLKNKILPFGIPAIGAKIVGADDSNLDGKPVTVLDYSKTAIPLARPIRDEVREVAPGLFLGVVYFAGVKTINFTLKF